MRFDEISAYANGRRDAGWCPSEVSSWLVGSPSIRSVENGLTCGRERTARTADRHCHVSPVDCQLVLPPNKPDTCEQAESIRRHRASLDVLKSTLDLLGGEIPSSEKKNGKVEICIEARMRII